MAEFKPALFKVGIFAVISRNIAPNTIGILVNVRTDQEKQRKLAEIPDGWKGVIVDLPGGTFQIGDSTFEECLLREVREETGGCEAICLGRFPVGPYPLIKSDTGTTEKPHDLAFAISCAISGDPRPTSEASEHLWVTLQQLEEEKEVRLVGKLGKNGRMAQMIRAATPTLIAHCDAIDVG